MVQMEAYVHSGRTGNSSAKDCRIKSFVPCSHCKAIAAKIVCAGKIGQAYQWRKIERLKIDSSIKDLLIIVTSHINEKRQDPQYMMLA